MSLRERCCDNVVKKSCLRQCNPNTGRVRHSKSREEFHQDLRKAKILSTDDTSVVTFLQGDKIKQD